MTQDLRMPQTTTLAMRCNSPGAPLTPTHVRLPSLDGAQVLLEIAACGVCRTDLHVLDGELPEARYPVTPGHEIVGRILAAGSAEAPFKVGDRVGVPWLGSTCGHCKYCRARSRKPLRARRVHGLHDRRRLRAACDCGRALLPADSGTLFGRGRAPLMCAGLIGYRALCAAGDAANLGLYGFGAAAHLLAQIAHAQGRRVFAFTRPGDVEAQAFARELSAVWAGGSDEAPPEELDAAIIFAPLGELVPAALAVTRKGGRVVCAGIHMSDIPSFPYRLLWGERTIVSVANLTRADGREFMRIADSVLLRPQVEVFPLAQANEALARLKTGRLRGAAVLTMAQ